MFKYIVTFDFDLDSVIHYDEDEQYAEINELDDDVFSDAFDSEQKINEFEEWFNDGKDEKDKISVVDIEYDRSNEITGEILITLNMELSNDNMETLAKEIVWYLFEGDLPIVDYHVSGTTYEDYWDYSRSSPEQRTVSIDYDDSSSINSYNNVKISKL